MKGVNRAELLGNLGAAPECKALPSGTLVANFNLATSERVKVDGEYTDHTEWHRCVAWARLAEICRDYLDKGSQVYITGRIRTRGWSDSDNNRRWTTEIIVNELVMLGGTKGGKEAPPGRNQNGKDEDDDLPF